MSLFVSRPRVSTPTLNLVAQGMLAFEANKLKRGFDQNQRHLMRRRFRILAIGACLLVWVLARRIVSRNETDTSSEAADDAQFDYFDRTWEEIPQKDKMLVKKAAPIPTSSSTVAEPETVCRSNAESKNKSSWFSIKVNTSVPLFINRVNRTITRLAERWWAVQYLLLS